VEGRSRILLVEDDRETRQLVEVWLREEGYRVDAVGRCASATTALRGASYDAVILDLRLPDGSGLSVCRELRQAGVHTPILVLTARTDVSSRVEGLDAGADDYLNKPFAIAELRARLRALLRRGALGAARPVFRSGSLRVDFARRQVSIDDREVPITRRELEVLARLVRADGRAVSREDLLEEIWGESTPETAASLEVIMSRLRRKLKPASVEPLIRTFRGHGYGIAPMERGTE
jgi:DNA-binding response OmpR family regulator